MEPFRILVNNFGKHICMLIEGQILGQAETHPTSMTESDFFIAEELGLVHEKTLIRGRGSNNSRNSTSINQKNPSKT